MSSLAAGAWDDAPEAQQEEEEAHEMLENLKGNIQQLLDLCAENEIDVPQELKEQLDANLHHVTSKAAALSHTDLLATKSQERKASVQEDETVRFVRQILEKLQARPPDITLRVKNGSYHVTNYYDHDPNDENNKGGGRAKQKIATVRSESPVFKLQQLIRKCLRGELKRYKEQKTIMEQINISLEPGKMYLVLGAPGSGKSTLLKMISNMLHKSRDHVVGGEVSVAGVTPDGRGENKVYWSNVVSYIDQIDRIHPYMTVQEVCEFAWRCSTGATHRRPFHGEGAEVDATIAQMDEDMVMVNKVLEVLGLARVKDTFVGDQTTVRGVSGGEKKRVTLAEMLVTARPVMCCDEISTGLDAATTFDITRMLALTSRLTQSIKIVSLLQPPPETVANFDELILLAVGKIIYMGPVEEVVEYFSALGYAIPERMDVADWLQALPTKDGWQYLKEANSETPKAELMAKHLSPEQFLEKFKESEMGKALKESVEAPVGDGADMIKEMAERQFQNSTFESLKLVGQRELLLWWRDKYAITAKIIQDFIMGIVVGTLFFQQGGESPQSILGVLFQSMFFCAVGAMGGIVKQFPDRSIFYKHQDANFFPTWTYVAGKSVASIPFALADAVLYGSMIYFFVGLARNDGASFANYLVFVALMFVTSLTSGLFFSVFVSSVQDVTTAQACMAITAVLFVLFSGFTVQPDVIPNYWIWAYWLNYFAWTFRGFVTNEFDSGRYSDIVVTPDGETLTQGEAILALFGFVDRDDEPYTFEWAGWGVFFSIACSIIAVFCSVHFLSSVRFATGKSLATDMGGEEDEIVGEEEVIEEEVSIPFTRVDLTFKDIHYTVKSSITDEDLELLKGIDGIVEAGKMTALMGSSGAGKTTLMDVLAMRKNTGVIEGEIRLNGHLQEEKSFRRAMGYVVQFDTQSPQLTIRETCDFSAKLRLDESSDAVTPETTAKFVEQTLDMLELTPIQDLQVGSDETGGLSFEQRKRLSIAVELVANPSILFLDEPTSGLDARAASIVMRGMKRIALSGRAVCATIHQPSIAIFNAFDSLLLLKRGGETVFFGPLGENSINLIQYLERYEATPKISVGENPSSWMLTCIGAGSGSSGKKAFDYAGSYWNSKLHAQCLERIDQICSKASEDNKVSFQTEYATSSGTQSHTVLKKAFMVYYRSPTYNVTRVMVSAAVALLFGSVYASQRVPEDEGDMNSRINSIFIAVLFLCVNAQNTVLKVFESERNMFYIHRDAKMYTTRAILRALSLAEFPFIFVTAVVFVVMFYFILGFSTDADKFFLFFAFVFMGLCSFTFVGQMLVSLFRDSQTAQGFGGLIVSFSSLFSGILIRPDVIPNFWVFMYWVMPGHYIFEGLFLSQFDGDDTPIIASPNSAFFQYLGCTPETPVCQGTVEGWIAASFPDFSRDNVKWNAVYLLALIVCTRVITFLALSHLDYKSN